jgi:hypothetical protein
MQVIYTSKRVMKMLGCALSIEKYSSLYAKSVVAMEGRHLFPVERPCSSSLERQRKMAFLFSYVKGKWRSCSVAMLTNEESVMPCTSMFQMISLPPSSGTKGKQSQRASRRQHFS